MKPAPRVLMFAPLCYPPAGAEAIVTAKLVVALLESGWGVKVLTQADFGHAYACPRGSRLDVVREVAASISGLPGVPVSGGAARRGVRTAVWVARAAAIGFREIRSGRYTHVLSRAAPQYGHLPAWLVRRAARLPWIANWSDPMPPARAPAPYGGGPSARTSRFSRWYCDAIVSAADWHTFPCERLMHYFERLYPGVAVKSSVVPHVALRGTRTPAEAGTEFRLCHCGSVSRRNPDILMEGVQLFLRSRGGASDVKLVFVTSQAREVQQSAARFGLEGVTEVVTGAGYEQSLARAAAASVLVVLEAPADEGIFFPSKYVDYLQTGRPVLAVSPAAGTLRDIIDSDGGGIAVDCRSAAAVAEGVRRLYDAWRDGSLDACYGSTRLLCRFGEEAVIERLKYALDRAAGCDA